MIKKIQKLSPFPILLFSFMLLSRSINAGDNAVILQYHHISDSEPKSTSITPKLFSEHLDYLENNKFHVLPLTEVTTALKDGKKLPDKTVVITFDDAYLNIYQNAYPILKKKGWPFTLFVSTEPVNRNFGKFLNWKQIQEMTKYGATIANHTFSHNHLVERKKNETTQSWLNRIKLDITSAEQTIKEKTGQNAKHFAWPFGETTPQLKILLSDLGYIGFGQQSGVASNYSDFTLLPRYPMASSYAKMNSFKLRVNSLPLPVTQQTPETTLITNDTLQPILAITIENGNFQKGQLRCYASNQGEIEVKWLDAEKTRFTTQAKKPLPIGRSRYNCTAPSMSGKQYYWHSHAWLRLSKDGTAIN